MQSIGERLEEARKRKGVSIREAAEATKIRSDYLHKFESNQFDIRLPEIYVRGFLRNYAGYLKLAPEKIINDYKAHTLSDGKSSRSVNREIYGKMDITTTRDESESAQPGTGKEPVKDTQTRPKTAQPGSSIAGLERVLLIKTGTLGVIGLVGLVFLIWLVSTFFRSSSSKDNDQTRTTTEKSSVVAPATDEVVTFVAVKPLRFKVVLQDSGQEFYQSTEDVKAGFRLDVPKVPIILTATAMENLQMEYKGKRYGTGSSGHKRVSIDLATQLK